MGIRSRVATKKPFLTARHRKIRLALAREHKAWTEDDLAQVLFSDETTLELVPNARRQLCYRTRKQKHQA
jgi:ribosome-binding protein aMBF1 (putative translation factor)